MICEECIKNSYSYLDIDQDGNHCQFVVINCEACGLEDDFVIPGWRSQDEMEEEIEKHYDRL